MSEVPPTLAEDDPLLPEERARANIYALLGRLFYAGPDADLTAYVCANGGSADEAAGAAALAQSWHALQTACKTVDVDAARHEHDTLFVGVGKSEVTPYTSHYIPDSAPDRHLVALRDQLAQWGLSRKSDTFEVEDHIAGLCDVMRLLIEQQQPLAVQQMFFERFIYPCAAPLFQAVIRAVSADFYKPVSACAQTFLEVERSAFEMEAWTAPEP